MPYIGDTHERGIAQGWDAANYADAYGSSETPEQEAARRGQEYADVDPTFDVSAYTTGFAEGWERYTNGQWQDGTPKEDD